MMQLRSHPLKPALFVTCFSLVWIGTAETSGSQPTGNFKSTPSGHASQGHIEKIGRLAQVVSAQDAWAQSSRQSASSHTHSMRAMLADQVLENAQVKLVFATQGGKLFLRSMMDKKRGTDFIEKRLTSQNVNNLWQMDMRAGAGTPQIRSAEIEKFGQGVQVARSKTAVGDELQFRWQNLPVKNENSAVNVTMRVLLPRNSALSQWRINVDNKSREYGAWIVKFPAINNFKKLSANGEQEFAVIPGGNGGGAGEGHLFPDPFTKMHAFVRTYPCYHQSMQFNAYYGPQGGLYLATHDGASNLKGFYVNPVKGDLPTMAYEVQNYPANAGVAGTDYRQEFASVVGPFQGDWYDASQIYRQWALQQKWARKGPLHQRKDIAPAIAKGSFWMMGTFEWEPTDEPLMRRLARSLPIEEVQRRARRIDVEKSLALVKEASDYFGYPIILWTNEWYEGGGDMSPPRYLPMNNLKEYFAELHKRYPNVTMSGYVAPRRFSIQTLEYNADAVASLEHRENGDPSIDGVMPRESNDQHARPCWTSQLWKDYWGKKASQIAGLGMDGFHVDEMASATRWQHQCFNLSHGHPIGGGTLYADTRREMSMIIRESARRVNPNFASHHEALNEIYIDVDDLQEVCTSPSNTNIPLFEAVFHDYNFQMGRRIIEWNNRRQFPPGKADGDAAIDEFTASFAQTYVWGNQPAWMRTDISTYAPKVAAVTKRFMDARYRSMKFLNVGQMMRPLTVTRPLPEVKTTWRFNDTPEHIMPAVINSVWKAADGSIGIVLANITAQPQSISYRFDLAEAGLKGSKFALRQIDGPQPQGMGTMTGKVVERTDTVPGQSVSIIEIKPAK
jgi:hypothetical protein